MPVSASLLRDLEAAGVPAARADALVAEGRTAFPELALDEDVFVRHLQERLPIDKLATAPLAELHLGELYLACACAQGS